MNDLSRRFLEAFEHLSSKGCVSGSKDFASKIGISTSMMTEISKGRSNVGSTALQNIVKEFEISGDWLLMGVGYMIRSVDVQIIHHPKCAENTFEDNEVVLYDISAAANLKTLFVERSENILGKISIPEMPKCDGAVYIKGDSMYPLLKSGDIIVYKQIELDSRFIFYGEIYLLSFGLNGEDYLTVKYVHKSEKSGYIKLVSYNTHHEPMDIPLESINAMALVKVSVRMNTMK